MHTPTPYFHNIPLGGILGTLSEYLAYLLNCARRATQEAL